MPKYDFSAFDDHKDSKSKYDFGAFDSHPEVASTSEVPALQSAAEGTAEGLTMGLKPILAGISGTAMDTLSGVSSPADILEHYRALRDAEKARQSSLEQANPKSYMAGELAGGIAPAIATAGASAPESGGALLNNGGLAERLMASVNPQVGQAADLGAKLGAVQGFAHSNADLTKGEIAPLAQDVAQGGMTGLATGALTQGLLSKAPTVGGAADSLENFAAKRAISATGPTKGQVKELVKKDRVLQQGKNLLADPYGDGPIVGNFAKPDAILDKAETLKEKAGQEIGDILTKLDSKYSIENPAVKSEFFNPTKVINEVKDLQKQFMINGEIAPLYESEYNKLDKVIETLEKYGNNPIDFKTAQSIKVPIQKKAYQGGKVVDDLLADVTSLINKELESSADKATALTGDKELYDRFLKAKDFYGTAKDTINSATGKVASAITNKDLGYGDYITGIGVASTHGNPIGLAAVGFKKAGEAYGNSLSANVANKTANAMRTMNQVFTGAPEAIKAAGTNLIASDNPIKQRLGNVLVEASSKDQIGRNALIFSLMQNSEYRDLMKELMNQ